MFKELKEKITEYLEGAGLQLYSFKVKNDYGISKIIEILVDGPNLNSDTLSELHSEIRLKFGDLIPDYYYVEVATAGAERPIKTKDDLVKAVGKYIYLVTPQWRGNADLISFEDDILILEILEKGRRKQLKIKYENASQMRLAVRM